MISIMKLNTKTITYSGLFIALGVLFPQVFHLFGGIGTIFLPMHIPVLLAGFFLGAIPSAFIGFLTVILSASLTGMPAVPTLYFIMVEVTAYGFLSGVFYKKANLNVYVSLLLSMIIGRIFLAASVYILQSLLSLRFSPIVYMTNAVINGVPGIVIQIVFIPALVVVLERITVRLSGFRES